MLSENILWVCIGLVIAWVSYDMFFRSKKRCEKYKNVIEKCQDYKNRLGVC